MKKRSDIGTLHALCRLRSTLEAFAVARWREAGQPAGLSEALRSPLDRLKRFAEQRNYPEFHQIDNQIHRIVIASAGLPALEKSWLAVVNDLDSWILEVKETWWPSLMALYREHVLLVDAWHSEDDWVAEEATHQHLEAGWHRMAMALGEDLAIDPVARAAAFMATHYASDLEMEWIARHVSYLSITHFNRRFRAERGISPAAFLKQVRLDRAESLLYGTRDSIQEIAHRVGYRNASHFARDFRRRFGTTPLACRRADKG